MAKSDKTRRRTQVEARPARRSIFLPLLAATFVLPIVGTFALILGFTGAMLITDAQFGIPAAFFFQSALDQLVLMDYLMGLVKTPVFGAIIAITGCHFGLSTTGGTEGVGVATTRTVVTASVLILVSDYFITQILLFALAP